MWRSSARVVSSKPKLAQCCTQWASPSSWKYARPWNCASRTHLAFFSELPGRQQEANLILSRALISSKWTVRTTSIHPTRDPFCPSIAVRVMNNLALCGRGEVDHLSVNAKRKASFFVSAPFVPETRWNRPQSCRPWHWCACWHSVRRRSPQDLLQSKFYPTQEVVSNRFINV